MLLKKNVIKLIIATISANFYIQLMPENMQYPEVLTEIVLSPSKVLSILICLLISFTLFTSILLSMTIGTVRIGKFTKLFPVLVLFCLLYLLSIGFWQTIILFLFTFIYYSLSKRDLRNKIEGEM